MIRSFTEKNLHTLRSRNNIRIHSPPQVLQAEYSDMFGLVLHIFLVIMFVKIIINEVIYKDRSTETVDNQVKT